MTNRTTGEEAFKYVEVTQVVVGELQGPGFFLSTSTRQPVVTKNTHTKTEVDKDKQGSRHVMFS